jgi:hypothetical protein
VSTSCTHYVMIGIKVPFPKDYDTLYDLFEPYQDNSNRDEITVHNGLTVVVDGMCGDYMVIGQVLAKGREEDGLPMTRCCATVRHVADIRAAILREFPKYHYLFAPGKASPVVGWAFTHWH